MSEVIDIVMAGLVPAIHALLAQLPKINVDARDRRGHGEAPIILAWYITATRMENPGIPQENPDGA